MKKHPDLLLWVSALYYLVILYSQSTATPLRPLPIESRTSRAIIVFPDEYSNNRTQTSRFPSFVRRRPTPQIRVTGDRPMERQGVNPITKANGSFSDSESGELSPKLTPRGTPECITKSNFSFCEQVDGYPMDEIKKLVKLSREEFQEIYGSEVVNSRRNYDDDDVSEERICRQQTRIFYPKLAKNEVEDWVYVVNDVDYTQTVTAEMCDQEGRSCSFLDANLPAAFKSICRQRYAYKRLLAVHPKEKKTYTDSFPIPSCCACYVKYPPMLGRSSRQRKIDE